jgi:TatD DNase family protein
MEPTLYDMHCHLDFMSNATQVARDAASMGLAIFATTVTPRGYRFSARNFRDEPNVRVGVGLHPWWVADGRCNLDDIAEAETFAFESPLVGEVGLDFSPAHADPSSFARQRCAFEKIARACAEGAEAHGPKVVSIHSVRSATAVLDVLELAGCLEGCRCIFHWFSGTSDELHRAVKAGCWFSVNEMMLRTRRGREYARQLPEGRLLLETDLPPGENVPFSAQEIAASLERTLAQLASIRGLDVRDAVCANSRELLASR